MVVAAPSSSRGRRCLLGEGRTCTAFPVLAGCGRYSGTVCAREVFRGEMRVVKGGGDARRGVQGSRERIGGSCGGEGEVGKLLDKVVESEVTRMSNVDNPCSRIRSNINTY